MFDPVYLSQPREISVETLALCNARCTFCPYPALARKGTRLETEVVGNLIRQMSLWRAPFFISPFKVNEPLLDSRLADFCHDVVERIPAATLRLFTNGSPLTPDNITWIGNIPVGRLEHLWISLNESNPQKYREVMALDFNTTARRLDILHHRVERNEFPHPVVVSRVTDREHIAYASPGDADFEELCSIRWPRFRRQIIKRDAWIDFTNATDVGGVPRTACARWWELNITAEGKAALCCMDGTGEYAIGDIATQSLLEIYNQPYLLDRRALMMSREGIEPCQRCTY